MHHFTPQSFPLQLARQELELWSIWASTLWSFDRSRSFQMNVGPFVGEARQWSGDLREPLHDLPIIRVRSRKLWTYVMFVGRGQSLIASIFRSLIFHSQKLHDRRRWSHEAQVWTSVMFVGRGQSLIASIFDPLIFHSQKLHDPRRWSHEAQVS